MAVNGHPLANGTNGVNGTHTAHENTLSDADVLIIGGGYAGLEAAQALALQLHSSIVFDSGTYRNARAQYIRMIPNWDGKHPEDLRAAQRAELAKYEYVSIRNTEIKSVEKCNDSSFQAVDAEGKVWRGKKVILATGVEELPPAIEGYDEGWARWIFHCLYSQGWEHRDSRSCGLLAVTPLDTAGMALQMAHISARMAGLVTFYTNGSEELKTELQNILKGNPHYRVDSRVLARLSKPGKPGARVSIEFEGGESAEEDFLTHLPTTRVKGPFAKQLGLDITPMGDYDTKWPFSETNVRGVFATGDAASLFKVAPIAVANGALCASGVVCRLHEEELGIPGLF